MKVIKNEEERFHETLTDGMAILSGVIEKRNQQVQLSFLVQMHSVFMTHMASRSN